MPLPFEVLRRELAGAHHRQTLFVDHVRWPDGTEASYAVWKQPDAALIVPYSATGTTFLVQQWRHSWESDAWELPAGTWEEGEDPLFTAQRELEEEAGLSATRWDSLGTARATAVSTMRFHLFLARDLQPVPRRPEIYEQDMVIREIAFARALDEAANGTIQHAASITALYRAARILEETK